MALGFFKWNLLRCFSQRGADNDTKKTTQSHTDIQGEGSNGGPEGRAHSS